jgi:hypothetical protein
MIAVRARSRIAPSRRQREAGFGLAVLMVVLAIVTVWLTNSALCAGYGVIAAASARDRLAARMAAVERAGGDVPDATGGAVFPHAPVDGFHDYLIRDRNTGALVIVAYSDLPVAGDVLLRQWRLSARVEGGRVVEVSAVIVDAATRLPRPGPAGAEFQFSQVVE